MKKPAAPKKGAKMNAPHKTGGGAKRKGVRASGAPVPAPAKHPQHHAHHPPGHRMTNPLVPAPHHHRHVKPKQPVKRKLSLGEGVACCVAEALAASLRLAGGAVSDSDVLALHYLAGGSENGGVSILAALESVSGFGLAGVRPVGIECAKVPYFISAFSAPLLLGVTLPGGPHALLADGDTWWSWGEPWPRSAFSGAVIEEAWAVQWAA